MKFKELKEYFESNELPQTLVVFGQWHGSVQANITEYIGLVETQIKEDVNKAREKGSLAMLNHNRLHQIYKAMQDRSNWNLTKEEWLESRGITFNF